LPVLLVLENKQRSSIVIGAVYFVIFMLTSAASRRSGMVADRFEKLYVPLNMSLIVGFSMGVLSGLFYNLELSVLSIVFFITLYIIQNLRAPMAVSYVSDVMEQDILATGLSAESQASSLAAAIIAVLIGFFADRYGVGSGLVIVSIILILTAPLYMAREGRGRR
jgi:hypothetical protein